MPPSASVSSASPSESSQPRKEVGGTARGLFQSSSGEPEPWRFLAIFSLFALGVSSLGWWAYTNEAAHLRQREYDELNAIAHFKAAQIADWLAERRWDAKLVLGSPFSRQDVAKWLHSGDAVAGERLKARMSSLLANRNYVGVELLDEAGKSRLAVGSARKNGAVPEELPAARDGADEPRLVDLHRDTENGPVILAYVFPIPSPAAAGRGLLGYLRIAMDPEAVLYPLLLSWPTPSPSAETLIARGEGESVLYLNELRHRPGTALRLRLPINGRDLPASRAALGERGIFEGRDYRDVEVISYLLPIPGTPWQMVTKVDRAEVFADIRQIALVTALATAILLIFTGAVLWLTWRRQQLSARLHLQQELERIADVSPGVIHSFRLHPNGSVAFTYASPAIRNVFGYAPEELMDDAGPVLARIHPDDALRMRSALEISARDLSTWHAEYRYRHPLRGEIWVEEKSVPTSQPDGTIVWHGFLSDVTERKRAEAALRESESRFSTVFRESPLATSISRVEDGLFIEVNDAFLRLFGRAREQVIGRTSAELSVWGDPADRPRLIRQLLDEGGVRSAEAKFRRQSGEMLDVLYSAGLIQLEGERYLLSLFSDVTTLRATERALAQSRERYHSLFMHMLDGYVLGRLRYGGEVAPDFICLDVNPAFKQLTGLMGVVGKWATEAMPGLRESSPELFEALGRVVRSGRSERLETYVAALERWFSVAIFSAEPDHFVAVFDNITERKRAQ